MSINNIIKDAKKSISNFCMTECNAYCCRKGTIPATEKELKVIGPAKTIDYLTHVSFILPCPRLIENKCMVHKKLNRPQACKDFPMSIVDDSIVISTGCFAVKEGKIFPYIKKLQAKGAKIIMD